ncbi:DDE-domain-containing protein, partial [Auricularia subglabra TFB-10046 SS5]
MDESGFQISVLMRRMVTGGKTAAGPKKKIQHAQSGSNRELVSVIATICADGTAVTPAVIFQGKNLMSSWVVNNPLKAHVGMSAKGYNNRVIGLAWMKLFELETRDKAPNGEKRLLIVDGHGSHYTIEALEFARAHNIEILAYPPHTTHALQGLDVVLFAPLKRAYTAAVLESEDKTGEPATKARFLTLFEGPWRNTFTPALIQEAFRKTGVWPLDPSVIL